MAKKQQRVEADERQLLSDIRVLTSRQFVYESGWCGMVPFDGKLTELQSGPPVPFAELTWREQADVLRSFIHWDRYPERAWDDEYRIRENIVAGKPPDRWLDGTSIVGEAAVRKQQQSDAFDRIAADPGKAWDETFGIMVYWANAAECNKVGFLAAYAAMYDVSLERFEKAVQHGLGRQDVSGGDGWTLRGQFEGAQIMLGKDERAEESPWPVPERAEPPSLAEQFRRQEGLPATAPEPGFTPILKDEAALSKDFQKLLDEKALPQPAQDKEKDRGIER